MRSDDTHHWTARFAADGQAARQDVYKVAGLVTKTELGLIGALSARDCGIERAGALVIVGVEQTFPSADVRLDLPFLVAKHLLPMWRVHDLTGFEIPVPHTFLGACERQRQALLALAQRGLGPFALGDIAHHRLNRVAVRILEQCARDFDLCDDTVEPDGALFVHWHGAAGEQSRHAIAKVDVLVDVKEVERRSPQHLVGRRGAEDPDRGRVHEDDPGVPSNEDAIGGQLHHSPILIVGVRHPCVLLVRW